MRKAHEKSDVTIAVVEDNDSILDAVTLILEDQQWNVVAYTSGEAFLLDLNEQRPDLLLLDPNLPGINGMEIVESMHEGFVTLPIIILTAYPSSDVTMELEKAGVNEILVKPVTEQVLLDSVRAALAKANSAYMTGPLNNKN